MTFGLEKNIVIERSSDDNITFNFTDSNALDDERAELIDFSNILNISANPTELLYGSYFTNRYNNFSDLGAWHGYYLPKKGMKNLYGGFIGPIIIAEEYPVNLGDTISKIKITNISNKQAYDLSKGEVAFKYYPGKLLQEYRLEDFNLVLELIFATNRSSLIRTKIQNNTNHKLKINLEWSGNIFNKLKEMKDGRVYNLGQTLRAMKNGVIVHFSKLRLPCIYFSTEDTKFLVNYKGNVETLVEGNTYTTKLKDAVIIDVKESYETYSTETYIFNEEELRVEQNKLQDLILNPEKYFTENNMRWQGYLDKTFTNAKKQVNLGYKNAIVKAIETLMTNYRSAAGSLLHDGVVPSMSYKWFIGMWAWDSWKQAVAIARFNGELAKNNIRALFDYQITIEDEVRPQDAGTIIDAIFYNKDSARGGEGENWNERNSKPPLAGWAVWNVYKATDDKAFLEEMYPKVVAYHGWWYTNRDHDKNGIVEYGGMVHEANNSKEEIILAAAWESGMDNAPRFDVKGYGKCDTGVDVFENKDDKGKILGYSINQESVDLNSYLYAEKGFLKSMAKVLENTVDANKYEKEAEYVRKYVRDNMFDKETGFFYDLQISSDDFQKKLLVNRGKGPEGWIPLWAKMVTQEEAKQVIDNMIDESKFNTLVPLGTASQDNPSFNESEYWRGPVWLDQAFYGVEALQNYGYYNEAAEMVEKMFLNAEGVVEDGPIRENYNPLTGEGMHTKNFSWSASSYYLMYQNILTTQSTTSQEGMEILDYTVL
ncbi:trehalase family glycosidase [Clostridium sp.]|uniref:MGH1-like glycoside hydrolase domain-containing protein n=1 Tax=Clostridium sp. TaxID=1506 RepID=UPI003464AA52